MVRELLEEAVNKFNERSKEDPKFREELMDKTRTIESMHGNAL